MLSNFDAHLYIFDAHLYILEFWTSLVHFHKQVTQKRGALHSTMGPQPLAGSDLIVER